ncbi:hypothetical protein BCEP4_790013 [Burkholderia cepacia]|nr:hypothetical protein BCEP4_790013 [Burkholderia cepacia]
MYFLDRTRQFLSASKLSLLLKFLNLLFQITVALHIVFSKRREPGTRLGSRMLRSLNIGMRII